MKTEIKIVTAVFALVLASQRAFGLEACPKCGDIDVPLPLSSDEGCGEPSYKLHCNNGVLELPSARGYRYKVLSIDPAAYRLTISPPEMRSDTCYSGDFPVEGLRFDEASPFTVSPHNTVLLLNCSAALLRSPLNCSATSLCRRFEADADVASGCKGALCCHFLKDSSMSARFIRVRAGGCTAYTSVVHIDETEPVEKWNYGVEIQWLPPNSN